MPVSPNTLVIIGLTASFSAVIAAIVSGVFSVINGHNLKKNTAKIEALKSDLNGDIERLKSRLGHGQVVSTTQWNAEFSAYQAIWKAMVAVRALASKIVLRESEMLAIGMPNSYLGSPNSLSNTKDLLTNFTNAAQGLLWAIHDNAPFYPAPIRKEANVTHRAAKELVDKNLTVLTSIAKQDEIIESEPFLAECKILLLKIAEGSDLVESLIRDRLAAVQVVNDGI